METIVRLINFYWSIISSTFIKREGIVKIENIDCINRLVIFSIRGISSPITLGFDEIVKDADLLKGLSSSHASYIGYYYGLYYYKICGKSNHPNMYFDCFKETPKNKYIISMIDRKGNIFYLDQINEIQNTKSPLQIMFDRDLIVKFTSLQSFYIGILSGISTANINNQIGRIKGTDQKLRLV